MINDSIKVTGKLTLTVIGPDGKVKETRTDSNLVVTNGKNSIANRMLPTPTSAAVSYMSLGSSTTAAAISDTDVGSILGSRVILDSVPTVVGSAITYTTTFGPGVGTGAVTEAGLYNASTGSALIAHIVFPLVTKGALDTSVLSWTVTIS